MWATNVLPYRNMALNFGSPLQNKRKNPLYFKGIFSAILMISFYIFREIGSGNENNKKNYLNVTMQTYSLPLFLRNASVI